MKTSSRLPTRWKVHLMVAGTIFAIVALIILGPLIDEHVGLNVDQIGWMVGIALVVMISIVVGGALIGFIKRRDPRENDRHH